MPATDKFERPVFSLRISITNRCNVRCFYCHHDGIVPRSYEMTPNEIYRVSKVAADLGVRKIRLSGGEPLVLLKHKGLMCYLRTVDLLN